jgi:hypothetical protein
MRNFSRAAPCSAIAIAMPSKITQPDMAAIAFRHVVDIAAMPSTLLTNPRAS